MSQQYPGFDDRPVAQSPTYHPAGPPLSNPPSPGQPFPGATQYHPAIPQPNYAAPTPYGFDARPEHPDAMLVLVLGVISLFSGITGPFAWYFGSRARRQLQAEPHRWSPSTGLTVGWVLGIITSLFLVLGGVLVVAWIGLMVVMMRG